MENGQRASALRFADRRVMALLGALAGQNIFPSRLETAPCAPVLHWLLGSSYSRAQMTYDLRRLRLKKLIERIGNSHRYRLTEAGHQSRHLFLPNYISVYFDLDWQPYFQSNLILRIWLWRLAKYPK